MTLEKEYTMHYTGKKTNILTTLLRGLALLILGFAGAPAFAGTIVNSAHDFSASGFTGGEICIACHTPHNADTSVTDAPLWNHEITAATFTMYSSSTLDATGDAQPTGSSKLCLSCHDGTVAIDSFGGASGTNFVTGPARVGANGDLDDDHPISITYDAALSTADPGLHDPSVATTTIGAGGTRTRTGTLTDVMLIGGKVECASCHDVHNTFTVPGSVGTPLLKVTRAGSELCLTCHNK